MLPSWNPRPLGRGGCQIALATLFAVSTARSAGLAEAAEGLNQTAGQFANNAANLALAEWASARDAAWNRQLALGAAVSFLVCGAISWKAFKTAKANKTKTEKAQGAEKKSS